MYDKIVKAEILWTRKCPAKCEFCNMIYRPGENEYSFPILPIGLWKRGIDNLKALGCEFFAIYGASPLYDFGELPKFVQYAERSGIATTVIADGIDVKSFHRLDILHDAGLRSLTVSYDGNAQAYDKWSEMKSAVGLDLLTRFRNKYDDLRDVEVVSTVTLKNWQILLKCLPAIRDADIWFSFDFVHPDRGHPGTKCRGDGEGYVFRNNPTHKRSIRRFIEALIELKEGGLKVHQSDEYLNYVLVHPSKVTDFSWKCTWHAQLFPAWLTIDCDGTVLPCDDFHTSREWKIWKFKEQEMLAFRKFYLNEIDTVCKGCVWSTHYDAVEIKRGGFGDKLSTYIHRKNP